MWLTAALLLSATPAADLDAAITASMKRHHVPAVSVAVIEGGRIAWARAYGQISTADPRPVTPGTLFQAASISKPIAALAALRLVQEGKLRLDEDVQRRLRSWKIPYTDLTTTEKVTLPRLLSHSAGLTVHGFRGYAAGEPVPTLLQVLNGEPPANSEPVRIDLVPGSKWRYSGGGYCVLQMLVTEVAGKPFPQAAEELVLQPLGMTRSTYRQPLPHELARDAAWGHDRAGRPIPGRWHVHPEIAAAGLWTTPSDLARAVLEVQRAYRGKSPRFLSAALARAMLEKQAGDYGLGFAVRDRMFSHGGSNIGFKCQLSAHAETGQGAVVMTNGDRGGEVASEILRRIDHERN
jgi:CubicO group peptidase (beta-lactamase class C family)